MKSFLRHARLKPPTQSGINMVDLMMWLVIAALLLAAAIQGIGYYQQNAYQYQMKAAAEAAAGRVSAIATSDGSIGADDADSVVAAINSETPDDKITLSVGTVSLSAAGDPRNSSGMELASATTTVMGSNEGLYLRASHDLVSSKDVLYYFSSTATMSAGLHLVNKGTDGIGSAIVAPPVTATPTATAMPTSTATATATATPTVAPSPPADSINTNVTPIAHSTWLSLFQNATAQSTTSTKKQFLFTISGVVNTSDYEVVWSGTGLETTNSKFAPTASTSKYWFIDVTPADARGFTVGDSYYTATVKKVATGETSVKSWKLSITPAQIQAHSSFTALYTDRSTTATTSTKVQYVFQIPGAVLPEYTVEWSGGAETNASIKPQTAGDGTYWFGDVTPADARGFVTGVSTITAKVTHVGSGTVFTKSWKLTVTDPQIVAHSSYTALFANRSIKSMTTSTTQFVFTVPNASLSDYIVDWTATGDDINATMTPHTAGSGVYWFVDVIPGTGGNKVGVSTITAKVTHPGTGNVMTKTWTLTVTQGGIMANSSYSGLFLDRTATKAGTNTVQYLFTMPGAHSDYEVVWTNTNAAGLNTTMTPRENVASNYWFIDVVPGTGGFASGTSDFTVTVKHIPTGDIYTKTFKLTVP